MVLDNRIFNILFQIGIHGSADNAVGASTSGARRVTLQERERQDADAEKRSDYRSMFKIHICIWYLLSLSMTEHRIQADEFDREFFLNNMNYLAGFDIVFCRSRTGYPISAITTIPFPHIPGPSASKIRLWTSTT